MTQLSGIPAHIYTNEYFPGLISADSAHTHLHEVAQKNSNLPSNIITLHPDNIEKWCRDQVGFILNIEGNDTFYVDGNKGHSLKELHPDLDISNPISLEKYFSENGLS